MHKVSQKKDFILFENDDYFIVNKPAGIPSVEGRGQELDLTSIVHQDFGDYIPAHRIDMDTSGVLVFAKTKAALTHVSTLFEKRKIIKEYHAVVDGRHQLEEVEIDVPLVVVGNQAKANKNDGKEAITYFNTKQLFGKYSLLSCQPKTGRYHQIRAHLASMHISITGDKMYQGSTPFLSELKKKYKLSKKFDFEKPMIERMALHAYSIEFADPTGKQLLVEAPYPKDFKVFLKLLNRFDRPGF